MSKVTVGQLCELHRQMDAGRVTSEALQEVIDNAVKIDLKRLFWDYIIKSETIQMSCSEEYSFGYSAAVHEIIMAFSEIGRFDLALAKADKIQDDQRKLDAFLYVMRSMRLFLGIDIISIDKARAIAERMDGWDRVGAFVDLYNTTKLSADLMIADKRALALPNQMPVSDIDYKCCMKLAIAFLHFGDEAKACFYARRAERKHLLDVERVRILLEKNLIDKALSIAEDISDKQAKVEALTLIVRSDKEHPPCMGMLDETMRSFSFEVESYLEEKGDGFVWARYCGFLAELGYIETAERFLGKFPPNSIVKSRACKYIAEALAGRYEFKEALSYAEHTAKQYNTRNNAYKAIAVAYIEKGDYKNARKIARRIGPEYYLLHEVYCRIGCLSVDVADFTSAYEVVVNLNPIDDAYRAARYACIARYIAKTLK